MHSIQLFLQQLINGVQLGSVYALIAVGYTMVYGILKFINFAHGDVYMVGAYTGLFVVSGFYAAAGPGHAASVDQRALVVVSGMVLTAVLIVSLRSVARKPASILVRLILFALILALLGTIVRTALAVCAAVFGVTNDLALPSVHIGGPFALIVFACRWVIVLAHRSVYVGGPLALIVSIVCCALLGLIIERAAYKPIRGAGRLTALITAIGISLLIENGGQAVFGARNKAYTIASLPGGQALVGQTLNLRFGGIALSVNKGQIIVLLASVVLVSVLIYIVRKTRMGKAMRATSFDRETASLMGINTDTVIAFTFMLGSGLAGAGGFLNYGLTQFSFDTQTGVMFGLKAFVAAVLGGIGNLGGAVLGGIIMGLAETFVGGSPFSSYKDAIAFMILIVILLFRPAGLLGRFTVEKV
jgi:branched-chain amino acid transport system permease protein